MTGSRPGRIRVRRIYTAAASDDGQRVLVDRRAEKAVAEREDARRREGLFSGSAAAEERHSEFTQSLPAVRPDEG